MIKIQHVVLLAGMILFSGCATQSALDNVRNDIDNIKTRMYSVDKDVAAVREDSKLSVVAVEKGFRSDVAAVRKMSADTMATIDSTKGEIRALNGKLDDVYLSLKKPEEDLARYREDADKRIIVLEDRIFKQQAEIDELKKKIEEIILARKAEATPAPLTGDALYLKGLETFKTGDMPAAREQFTKFLEQNPQHELAANAQFWIGETYYGEKSYEPAILAYQEVIKNYPGKEKVAAAMLKQAMAFNEINDGKSAKYVLKKLLETFPKSEEAKRAKALLKDAK
ncbi:MAG: tol-pal system protein YbgF [Geobacter sp.]|nr:tol-pal system protein YbgF [Geobacter sp.]